MIIARVCYRHSLWLLETLSVCVCLYPAFTAYISVTVGQILMKLGGSQWSLKDIIPNFFMIFFTKGQNFNFVQKKAAFAKANNTPQTVVQAAAILLLKIKYVNTNYVLNVQ